MELLLQELFIFLLPPWETLITWLSLFISVNFEKMQRVHKHASIIEEVFYCHFFIQIPPWKFLPSEINSKENILGMKIWRKMCRNVKKESGLYKENRAVEAGGTKTLPTFHQRWPRKYGDNLFLFISDEIIFVKKKHLGFLQYSMLVFETYFDGESRQYLIKIFIIIIF